MPDLTEIHAHSSGHKVELERSPLCGCFYCCQTFETSKIQRWVDKGETALCPLCGIDSVIGSASGVSITYEFLKEMHDFWFFPKGEY